LTLAVEPTFSVLQDVYQHLPMPAAIDRLDD